MKKLGIDKAPEGALSYSQVDGGPGGTRTHILPITSRVLCAGQGFQFSYGTIINLPALSASGQGNHHNNI